MCNQNTITESSGKHSVIVKGNLKIEHAVSKVTSIDNRLKQRNGL